jgi:hypothetical protein
MRTPHPGPAGFVAVSLGAFVAYLLGVGGIFGLQALGWLPQLVGYPLDDVLLLSDTPVLFRCGVALVTFLAVAVWKGSRTVAVLSGILVPVATMAVTWRLHAQWAALDLTYGDTKQAGLALLGGVSLALTFTLWAMSSGSRGRGAPVAPNNKPKLIGALVGAWKVAWPTQRAWLP